MTPDSIWTAVYLKRLHWTAVGHTKRFDKADRAKRLAEYWASKADGGEK